MEIIFQFKGIREETGFHVSRIPDNTINCTECEEIVKIKNLGFVEYFDFKTIKHYFYFFRFNLMERTKSNLKNSWEMPWNINPFGETANSLGQFWPNQWILSKGRPVLYIPNRYELVFIANWMYGANATLYWNYLNDWSKSLVIDANLHFHAIFEQESIMRSETKAGKREAQVFAYNQTSDNSRKFVKTVNINNFWLIFRITITFQLPQKERRIFWRILSFSDNLSCILFVVGINLSFVEIAILFWLQAIRKFSLINDFW